MKSLILSRNSTVSTTVTRYFPFASAGGQANNTTVANCEQVASCSGVVSRMYVVLSAAPGSGKSYTATVMKNGSATALAVTVSDAATSGSNNTDSVAFGPGDCLAVRWTPSGTPAANTPYCAFEIESSDGQPLFTGQSEGLTEPGTSYFMLQNSQATTTIPGLGSLIPADGVIKSLYLDVNTAPGSGNSWTVTLVKNGSDTSLTATISGAGVTTGSDTTNSVTVAPGDTCFWRVDTGGDPLGSGNLKLGAVFRPTIDGTSIYTNSTNTLPTANRYIQVESGIGTGSGTSEGGVQNVVPADGYTLQAVYTNIATAPGAGTTRTFNMRKNSGFPSPNLTTTYGAAETGGKSDNTPTISYDTGDTIVVQWAVTGTPASTAWAHGLKMYKAPTSLPISRTPHRGLIMRGRR